MGEFVLGAVICTGVEFVGLAVTAGSCVAMGGTMHAAADGCQWAGVVAVLGMSAFVVRDLVRRRQVDRALGYVAWLGPTILLVVASAVL